MEKIIIRQIYLFFPETLIYVKHHGSPKIFHLILTRNHDLKKKAGKLITSLWRATRVLKRVHVSLDLIFQTSKEAFMKKCKSQM